MNGLKLTQKRAVSQIIGSLAMMAIVTSVGSVIMFQGLSGIQDFNNLLSEYVTTKNNNLGENLVIEHVRFQTSGDGCTALHACVTLWIRNIGIVDAKIKTIKVMNKYDQVIVLNADEDLPVYVKNYAQSQRFTNLVNLDLNKTYKIAITTEKGNSFSFMATSYNT